MPKFTYTAKTQPNQTIQGSIDAESEADAINKLTKQGYFPLSIKSEELAFDKENIFRLRRISRKDIVMFTRQLSTLVESGVNVINGLSIISNQTPNKYLKAVLSDVGAQIRDGKSLSESLFNHPYLFSDLYTSVVHTGEASGNLTVALSRLADFLEKEEEFKNSLRASLTYPVFVFAVGVLTILVLLLFVIPRLVSMFEDMGQTLPLPTRILINTSASLRSYGWLYILIIFVCIFFLRRFCRSQQGRIAWDRFKLKLPVTGLIVLKTEIGRLMRTLSLLISSGINIVPALSVSAAVIQNQIIKQEAQKFKDGITGGLSLSKCLANSKLFPLFVTNIVAVGEETGVLEKSLMRIADDYERDVDRTLKTLTRLLEPVIILVMGVIVGFIVLSMLLPIFQINLIVR